MPASGLVLSARQLTNGAAMSLRAINSNVETATRAGEFVATARYLTAAGGDRMLAAAMAEAAGGASGVVSVLRAAAAPGTIDSPTWGGPLAQPYAAAAQAFLGSLRNAGAFDRMLPDMRVVPLRTRVGAVTVGATGYIVGEGRAKPIGALSLASGILASQKAVAILVVTNELARATGPEGTALFGRELRAAVASVTDQEFVTIITAGRTPIPSGGSTAAAVRADLAAALGAIETDASSRLYVLVRASTAKSLAIMGDGAGGSAFPDMTPQGGTIAGIPVVVTDGLAGGTIAVVDANGLTAGSDAVTLDTATQADVEFSNTPSTPPGVATVLRSLWQHNMTALRVERWFGAEVLRPASVAVIGGVAY